MNLNFSSSINNIGFRKALKKQQYHHYEFLIWGYGKHPLKQLDMDRLNCCTFVLSGNCKHIHKENSCVKCVTSFSFFKRTVLPFLKTFNEEVSLNNKCKAATMMAAVPNLSHAISHFASHSLCANVKFYAIKKIMQSMKTYTSIIYMDPDHQRKFCRWDIGRDRLILMVKKAWFLW